MDKTKKKHASALMKIAGILFFFLFTACNSTQVISSWSLPNPPQGAMNKTLVFAVIRNMETRDQIEQAMAMELQKQGVASVPAMNVFGPKVFSGLTEKQISEKLKDSDFTSVMIVSIVNKERVRNYVPGNYYSFPQVVGYSRYYRRYMVVYDQIYTPGYYTNSTNYVLEADIYTIHEDELIYSAQTRSYDPSTAKTLAEEFAQSIVTQLKEKGIIRTVTQ